VKRNWHYHKKARAKYLAEECFACGSKENLCLHHIDGNGDNHDKRNLITYCAHCHMQGHFDKKAGRLMDRFKCRVCKQPAMSLNLCERHFEALKRYGHLIY
jgi:hypothetical protein